MLTPQRQIQRIRQRENRSRESLQQAYRRNALLMFASLAAASSVFMLSRFCQETGLGEDLKTAVEELESTLEQEVSGITFDLTLIELEEEDVEADAPQYQLEIMSTAEQPLSGDGAERLIQGIERLLAAYELPTRSDVRVIIRVYQRLEDEQGSSPAFIRLKRSTLQQIRLRFSDEHG